MNKALVVIDIQNDITKHYKDIVEGINKAIDWAAENGMYILKKIDEMLVYYEGKGCEVKTLAEYIA